MNTAKNFTTIHLRLDGCLASYNTLNDLSNKVFFQEKETEDLNPSVFNVITGMNEQKRLTKNISYECKQKLDEIKFHSDQ